MSCNNCTKEKNNNHEPHDPAMVSLAAIEGTGYRRERTLRWTVIVFCVSLFAFAILSGLFCLFSYRLNLQSLERVEAINQHWLEYLSEYDFSSTIYEYSQDGQGLNIIGDNNGVELGVIEDGAESENYCEETH